MKNRKTNFIKLGILLFGFSFLLWNCTQVELNQPEKFTESKKLEYSVEKINYEDLKTDLDFQNSLKIIESKIANKKHRHHNHNTFHKNTTQVNEDLSILTEQVNKVETNDGTISWTFETEHPVLENSDFENFVVKKVNDVFYYYLISYQVNYELVEDAYQNIKSYRVREEYLSLDNLNLHQRGDDFGGGGSSDNLDWIYPDDGGGDSYTDCVNVYTEIEPCSSGGYHTLKYACQHMGGVHGVSNSPPCSGVCSGTEVVTVIDYTYCTNYSPPSGPSTGTSNTGNTGTGSNGIPTNGGSNPTNNNTSPTVTAPLSNSDGTVVDTSTIVADQINDELGNTLTRDELKWLEENEVEALAISNLILTKSDDFINATIDILSGNANTSILTNLTDNQSFLNLIGNILNTKNNIIFPDFNIIFNNFNEFNNLILSDWHIINAKIIELNNVTQFYNISSLSNINQFSPPHQSLVVQNSLFINFLPSLKDLGIQLPQTSEEWQEFGEILIEVMYEIIPDLIPGIAELNSLKNAVSAFNSGNYTDGSSELAFAIIGVFPAGKIMKALAKFAKLVKKTAKIFKTYLKLFKLNKSLARGFKKIIKDGNKMHKIFGNTAHKLDALVLKAGGRKEALLAVVNRVQELNLSDQIPLVQPNGWAVRFDNIEVLGENLTMQIYKNADGSIINISDMWKP